MTRNATQLEVLAVEEETLVLIHIEVAEAKLILHTIHFLTTFQEHGYYLIQIRISHTVPQMRMIHAHVDDSPIIVDDIGFLVGHHLAGCIHQLEHNLAVLIVRLAGEMNLCTHLSVVVGQ